MDKDNKFIGTRSVSTGAKVSLILIAFVVIFLYLNTPVWLAEQINLKNFNLNGFVAVCYGIFIIISLLFFKPTRKFLHENQWTLAFIGILITLGFFFLENYHESEIKQKRDEVSHLSIRLLNQQNLDVAKTINNESSSPSTFYWWDFITEEYQDNWGYIISNNSNDCIRLYAKMVSHMQVANNIIQDMRSIALISSGESNQRQINFGQARDRLIHNNRIIFAEIELISSTCR